MIWVAAAISLGSRVRIFLNQKSWHQGSWFAGTVTKIEPYSTHRNFYWVELDEEAQEIVGVRLISVLNLKNIEKIEPGNEH